MELLTVPFGEVDEASELVDGGGNNAGVICLADGGHMQTFQQAGPQARPLGRLQLVVATQPEIPVTVLASLLHPQLVLDWPHHGFVVLTECLAIF